MAASRSLGAEEHGMRVDDDDVIREVTVADAVIRLVADRRERRGYGCPTAARDGVVRFAPDGTLCSSCRWKSA